jgi:hypothetical protein
MIWDIDRSERPHPCGVRTVIFDSPNGFESRLSFLWLFCQRPANAYAFACGLPKANSVSKSWIAEGRDSSIRYSVSLPLRWSANSPRRRTQRRALHSAHELLRRVGSPAEDGTRQRATRPNSKEPRLSPENASLLNGKQKLGQLLESSAIRDLLTRNFYHQCWWKLTREHAPVDSNNGVPESTGSYLLSYLLLCTSRCLAANLQ